MVIRGDDGSEFQFTHDRNAGAVGEGEVLVAVLKEKRSRAFEAIGFDPLPSQSAATVDLLPPDSRHLPLARPSAAATNAPRLTTFCTAPPSIGATSMR